MFQMFNFKNIQINIKIWISIKLSIKSCFRDYDYQFMALIFDIEIDYKNLKRNKI